MTSDRLIGAEIVLADGRILACDENHDEDLFWALRGAGAGNFGVVTALLFRTVPAPDVTNFHVTWPYSRAADVIGAWQRWAPYGPDELAASLKVTADEDIERPPSVDVYGAFLGEPTEVHDLLDPLIVRSGSDPSSTSMTLMPYPETRRFWAELGEAEDATGERRIAGMSEGPYLACKSEFFSRPLPTEAISALLETFVDGRAPGETRELDFMPWGGAYNRVPSDATAFVHRDELFQLKQAAVVAADAPMDDHEAARRAVHKMWASVHSWGSGRVFQNFADPELEHWGDAYYGHNLARLVRVKARYDPSTFFNFDQSLPVRR